MPLNPSIVKLQALAADIKLRVDVSAQQLDAAVRATLIEGIVQYVQLRAGIDAGALNAQAQYTLMKADAIVGDFLKLIGLADALTLTETQIKDVHKAITEVLALTENVVRQLAKPVSDQAATADTVARSLAKPLAEAKTAIDTLAKTFAKPLPPEALAAADSASIGSGKNLRDATYQMEGPAVGQTYADLGYFAQDYSWDGLPIKLVSKVLGDTVHATDDFYGAANVDDDQVIWVTKTLADTATTSETMGKVFNRPGVADAAAVSDVATRATAKSFTDLVAAAEIVVRGVAKNLTDSAQSSETLTRRTDKALSEFPLSAADLRTFSLAKVATDTATTGDSAVRSVGRVAADAVSQTDAATKNTGKALADTSATSDSGSIRKTNYADITYFAQDYVGTTINF